MSKQVRSAVVWSGIDLILRQGVNFAVLIILARLLMPEDFGVIALLAFFIGIANVFADAGFSVALIQKSDVSHVDESTIFWFNFIASGIIALILIGVAPWISNFYEIDVLQNLLYLSACVVVVSSLGSIHRALLSKALNFKTQAIVGLISMLISSVVAVYMAYDGYAVWALAIQVLLSACVTTTLLWVMHGWRPLFIFSLDSLKGMIGFSGYMFAAQILQVLYDKGYTLLLGKFFGISQLGLFDRADRTQRMVSETMTGVISKVAFPLYSRYSDNQEKLRKIVRQTIRLMMLVMAPLMLGMLVMANLLIPIVFGEQWRASVSIFQVLCVVGLLYPLQSVNVTVLQAQGHADLNFRLSVVKKASGISLLVIGSYWGVMGVAWAMVLQSFVALVINGYYSKKLLGYGTLAQLKDCMSSFFVSLVMVLGIFLFNAQYPMDAYLMLIYDISLGIVIYLGMNIAMGLSAFKQALEFIRGAKV